MCGARKPLARENASSNDADIIAELPVFDPDVAQDVARQDVKIKVGRDLKLSGVGKDRIDQSRIIEHGVAGLGVGSAESTSET